MAITINFEADSDYTIGVIPGLFESLFFNASLNTNSNTFWTGFGSIDGDIYDVDVTGINMTGSSAVPPSFSTFEFDFFTEVISWSDLNIPFIDLLPLLEAYEGGDDYAFISYLMDQSWVMNLSDNADIALAETLGGGTSNIEFNLRGDDIIYANGGNDQLFTGDGADTVYGGNGNDRLFGGNGNDRVNGGNGSDVVVGADGNDYLIGGNGDDRAYGGRGQDRMYGSDGLDRLYGGSSADVIVGGADRDYINGGIGNDRIYGGGGFDQLYGNGGNDLLVGGSGADDFIFRDGQGDNTIRDFNALNNSEDIILRGVTQITSFNDLSANHMTQVGANVVIDDGAGLTITLQNVDIDDLGARDFIF